MGDLLRVVEKLRQGYGRRVLSMLLPSRAASRVIQAWSHENAQIRHWWEIPRIRQEWNRAISGDPDIDYTEHLSRSLFQDAKFSAYSICSGEGGKEIRWAKTGAFTRIDAVDISPARVKRAVANAARVHQAFRNLFVVER